MLEKDEQLVFLRLREDDPAEDRSTSSNRR